MIPIALVLSVGSTAADTKAERGALSVELKEYRSVRSTKARAAESGIGIKARKTVEGRCANTIVYEKSMVPLPIPTSRIQTRRKYLN